MLTNSSCGMLARRVVAQPACSACQVQRRFAHKLVEVELLTDYPALGLRGTRHPVSRGLARNQLVPLGVAYLIGTDGNPVSAVRDMKRKGIDGSRFGVARDLERERRDQANKVLQGLQDAVEDPARTVEQTLLASLSSVAQPLVFSRLTTSSTSSDLFGSVSVQDVVHELRERDVRIEDAAGAFEAGDGVEKGRVKKTGTFNFLVHFRALDQTYPLKVQVVEEQKDA
ncbi:hypothetical protein JCM10212_003492 [Sporobolomyces blumeae]